MRRNIWCIGLALGYSIVGNAAAQGPVMDGVYIPNGSGPDPAFVVPGPQGPTDIPLTSKTVTLPAGIAVITWSITCQNSAGQARVRPAIGNASPATGLQFDAAATSIGTWTTHIDGGETHVRLQAEILSFPPSGGIIEFNVGHNATWSLVVIPDSTEVPAIGAWGIVIFAILLATAGSVVLAKRPGFRGAE